MIGKNTMVLDVGLAQELPKIKTLLQNEDVTYVNSGLLLLEPLLENEVCEIDEVKLIQCTQYLFENMDIDLRLISLYEICKKWPHGNSIAWFFYAQMIRCHPDLGTNLTELNLIYDAEIDHLPFEWEHFPNLKVLSLGLMPLSSLPPSIEVLRLPKSHLEHLKHEILDLQHLHTLVLTLVNDVLPDWLPLLKNLRKLVLVNGDSATIPDMVTEISSLEHLEIRFRSLNNFPKNLGDIALKRFEIQGCQLTSIPKNLTALRIDPSQIFYPKFLSDIQQSTQLQSLDLRDASYRTIPQWVYGLEHLQDLNLSNNGLQFWESKPLPKGLKNLNLAQNRLRHLHLDWAKILRAGTSSNNETDASVESVELEHLDLSFNRLLSIPDDFAQRMTNVHLNLVGNPLKYLSEHLVQIQLDDKQWLRLQTQITTLPKLTSLSLAGLYLTELPESLQYCTHLQCLDIRNNELSQLPDWLSVLPNLQSILTQGNPLVSEIKYSEGHWLES